MNEKYFAELARVLAKKDIKTAPPENGRLPILLGNYSIGRVEPSGTMCLTPDDLQTPETSDLYFRVAPIADTVKEYMLSETYFYRKQFKESTESREKTLKSF